jgi:hypothetical protein
LVVDYEGFLSDDWCTPQPVIDCLSAMGGVGLDPCSNKWSRVPARHKYDIRLGQDGLVLPWEGFGLVYCNPPYSDPKPWLAKGAGHPRGTVELYFLLNATTDTQAFHEYVWKADALCFWKRRLKFEGPLQHGPRSPQVSAYWGSRAETLFAAVHKSVGKVILRP